jgi:predicted nucleic acid-binding protein
MSEDNRVVVELTLDLPDSVAREAEADGLLTSAALEALLRAELRRRAGERLAEIRERLAALPLSPLTEEEVEAEIQAVRAARREAHARSS